VDIGASAKLELVDKFCYLGDMLSVDGDADAAVEARIRIGWNKFRKLVPPLLTNKDVSLIMRGRLYSSCVRSSMLHGSETWGPIFKTSQEDLRKMTELRKILGKSYEKLKKILRKTYDHNLAILSWPLRSTSTNKYLILRKTRTKEDIN